MLFAALSRRAVRAALLCSLAVPGLRAANRPLTCFTWNVYAFPPKTQAALKALSDPCAQIFDGVAY